MEKFEKAVWTNRYSVGVDKIDDQHKIFIDIINRAIEQFSVSNYNAGIKILDELISYARQHFVFEHGLMTKYNYPESNSHAVKHDEYVEKIVRLKEELASGMDITDETLIFLKDWLFLHIDGTDKKLGKFLQSRM